MRLTGEVSREFTAEPAREAARDEARESGYPRRLNELLNILDFDIDSREMG